MGHEWFNNLNIGYLSYSVIYILRKMYNMFYWKITYYIFHFLLPEIRGAVWKVHAPVQGIVLPVFL